MEERLQNILAKAGVASRRGAAEIIADGRVIVDGRLCREPGARFDPELAEITLDGRRLAPRRDVSRTVMLWKPAGVLCTMSDPFGGTTVADLVPCAAAERLVPAGRLDRESEGLLLMTNDGGLALRLTHPRYGHSKTYTVRTAGHWDNTKLAILRAPTRMPDGYLTRPAEVEPLELQRDNTQTLRFTLHEGRKRQIRHLCAAARLTVLSLRRTAIGRLELPRGMKPGEWRDLRPEEIDMALEGRP